MEENTQQLLARDSVRGRDVAGRSDVGFGAWPLGGKATESRPLLPLTERVLSRLPGSQLFWALLWGMLASAAYYVVFRRYDTQAYPGLPFVIGFAYFNCSSIWGVRRLWRKLQEIEDALVNLAGQIESWPRAHPFRNVGSVRGTVVLALMFTLAFEVADFVRHPGFDTAVLIPVVFVGKLPSVTMLWVYFQVLFGLNSLGRTRLHLEPYWLDKSLGLRPLGSLALSTTSVMALVVVPFFLVYLPFSDFRSVFVIVVLNVIGVAFFFLSLYRLHRQLVDTKSRWLRWARKLYAEAFEPIPAVGTVEALGIQASPLSAAVEAERRAAAMQEWPFDDTIIRALFRLAGSAIAAAVARLALVRVGFQ